MQAFFVYRSGFFGTVVEYGAETKISRHSILGASVSVGVPQGVSLKIKYEADFYFIFKLQVIFVTLYVKQLFYFRLNRASQTYFFPIHLTDQLLPSAVFYATVGPLVFYLAIQRLVIKPYMSAQKEQ